MCVCICNFFFVLWAARFLIFRFISHCCPRMSQVIKSLSNADQYSNPELNVETVFKEPPPPPENVQESTVFFLQKHKKSFAKIVLCVLFYVIGCAFYRENMGWDTLDSIYFITVSSKLHMSMFEYTQIVIMLAQLLRWDTAIIIQITTVRICNEFLYAKYQSSK